MQDAPRGRARGRIQKYPAIMLVRRPVAPATLALALNGKERAAAKYPPEAPVAGVGPVGVERRRTSSPHVSGVLVAVVVEPSTHSRS